MYTTTTDLYMFISYPTMLQKLLVAIFFLCGISRVLYRLDKLTCKQIILLLIFGHLLFLVLLISLAKTLSVALNSVEMGTCLVLGLSVGGLHYLSCVSC